MWYVIISMSQAWLIVPWEDMCLLAMNSLHSDNHKLKKEDDKEEEKNLFKFIEENYFINISALLMGITPSTSPLEVKVKNVW